MKSQESTLRDLTLGDLSSLKLKFLNVQKYLDDSKRCLFPSKSFNTKGDNKPQTKNGVWLIL